MLQANRPAPGTRLLAFAELNDPGAKGLIFGQGRERFDLLLLRWRDQLFAYENDCPHAHTTLDWAPEQFFNKDKSALQCGTHGALFEPETGYCFLGPCKGKALLRFAVKLDDDGFIIAV